MKLLHSPNMRFVPVKTEKQQAALMQHKSRELLVRQQTMLINALREHIAEFGLIAPSGKNRISSITAVIEEDDDDSVPALAKAALKPLVVQLRELKTKLAGLNKEIAAWHKANEVSQRLATMPGVGVLTASAIAAAVPDPSYFRSGREFSAWLGLVPRQSSSGG